ncbi:type I-C CRISPR-associated protein Cas5c [Pseudoalteromonas ardens]|uniref:pre-crRNA processing endonuclease n=1 Tax=Pseudoalteromonas rubra TaxID=43658 RepID=A0A0L0EPS4_9GAMM|nr:type I-C CRISPR-associated protein Cas5c [Pseudoalteromonas sp. R96]KNC66380.1 CRISPR-associated protein [Pseudoalteromonas rubra]MDK1310321.1 type I-C CRISPR-associated protein Cas5c [Pseudoalteromonas sp. R96]
MKNSISFRLWGRHALFSDPITRVGGEKCSYHIPTYEAIKGVLKSIYWKPTLVWHVDKVRVIKPLRTQTRGTKPLNWGGGNSLAYYTFLHDVEYQVLAHFEWNEHRPELAQDRVDGKHFAIAKRMLNKGGRQDIFLGTRDCQGYVEPCEFGEGKGAFDDTDELGFGLMFHGFDYPDETGKDELRTRFWHAVMKNGVIDYPTPKECPVNRYVRDMKAKAFELDSNMQPVASTEESL